MSALIRVGGFALGLAGLTAATYGVGHAVGPVGTRPAAHTSTSGHGVDAHGGEHAAGAAAGLPAGLQSTEDGYRLELLRDSFPAQPATLRFRVTGPDGAAITDFVPQHGKRLHLIVVRRDLATFQHVHPTMAGDGTWSTELDLSEAGEYRVFADVRPAGASRGLTLGHDVSVAGEYAPRALPAASDRAVVDGYEVALDGDLVPGRASRLTLTVSRAGVPVTDLEPYLEAFGHLVVLRDGDLAYLHVHPDGEPGDGRTAPGPEVTFVAEVPSAGTYRMFLDFKHDGVVRTAAFTATTVADTNATAAPEHDASGTGGHTH